MKYLTSLLGLLLVAQPVYAANYGITGNALGDDLIVSALYSIIGIIIAMIVFKVIDFATPGSLGKQIADDKNMSLAIVVGSLMLGVCIIIAAAIHG